MSHLDMTVGFAIHRPLGLVALVEKQKPEWQVGKLNGIGGKMKQGETPLDAQRREFREETGRYIHKWKQFCTIYGKQIRGLDVHSTFTVHFLSAFVEHEVLRELKSMEAERIIVDAICNVNARNAIPNLPWLLRMAMDVHNDTAECFEVHEQYVLCVKCSQTAHPDHTMGSSSQPIFYCENCSQSEEVKKKQNSLEGTLCIACGGCCPCQCTPRKRYFNNKELGNPWQ